MELTGKLSKFDFNHWQHHIPIPDDIAEKLIDKNHRRVLVWVQDTGPYHMALFKAKICWYVLINQQIRSKLHLEVDQLISIKIERDHSEFGHDVPEEFTVMLDQDSEAEKYFKLLTTGKQRSLIYLVGKVKNPESRIKKALAITHHLRLSKGKLDYKQLNELIKYYNNL